MNAIDTNILVYAFDSAYPKKQRVCRSIVSDIFHGKKQGVITNQILAEFATVITKKTEKPLSKDDTHAIIEAIISSSNWKIINYTEKTVLCAVRSNQSFWDSLITQTLLENNVRTIITENEKHFKNSGIKVINPF